VRICLVSKSVSEAYLFLKGASLGGLVSYSPAQRVLQSVVVHSVVGFILVRVFSTTTRGNDYTPHYPRSRNATTENRHVTLTVQLSLFHGWDLLTHSSIAQRGRVYPCSCILHDDSRERLYSTLFHRARNDTIVVLKEARCPWWPKAVSGSQSYALTVDYCQCDACTSTDTGSHILQGNSANAVENAATLSGRRQFPVLKATHSFDLDALMEDVGPPVVYDEGVRRTLRV
jgi:hypothetical protein